MRTDSTERAAFRRWMKRVYPGVSLARYGKPARDQYIVPDVQNAWLGWRARAQNEARRRG